MVAQERHVLDVRLELVGVHTGRGRHGHPFRTDRERRGIAGTARRHAQRADSLAAHVDIADLLIDARDAAGKPVVLADEAGHEGALGLLVETLGRRDLLDAARPEDRDAVGHHQRLLLVVGHVEHRHPEVAVDAPDLVLHFLAQTPVERAERLVHQHQLGLEHQRAGDCHPLLLATRELAGPAALQPLEPHELQRAAHPPAAALGIDAAHVQRERQVLPDGHVRKQGVVLEDHADAPPPRRHLLHGAPGDADDARRRRLETGQHHQAGGLARTGRSEQGEELPLADLQVEIAHHQRPPVERLADAFELDVRASARGLDVLAHRGRTDDGRGMEPCQAARRFAVRIHWAAHGGEPAPHGGPMRIVSWNVNGLRACARKGFLDFLSVSGADVVGLQEVRAFEHQLDPQVRAPEGWHAAFSAAERPGYSGVAIYSRLPPDSVETSLGEPRFDAEGRFILARFGRLGVASVYFPKGSGRDRDNSRVPYKLDFYAAVFDRLQALRRRGPVLVIGDYNTAHEPIDLARPKTNANSSGFLPEERARAVALAARGLGGHLPRPPPRRAGPLHLVAAVGRRARAERRLAHRLRAGLAGGEQARHGRLHLA